MIYKAVTLIELLAVLAITLIAGYFISPVLFKLQDYFILNNQINQIRSFFYQVQSSARYTKQNYSFTLHSNHQEWCIIALAKVGNKKNLTCDCLNPTSCDLNRSYFLYKNKHYGVTFKSKSLYPNVFLNFDGRSGRSEAKCLGVGVNQLYAILKFEQNAGVINVIQGKTRSKCKQ